MSALRKAVRDYLEIRRSLGYKLKQTGRFLHDFVSHIEDSGTSFITEKAALAWATQRTDTTVRTQAERLSDVRLFAHYVHALDQRTEIPRKDLLPYRRERRSPYIYSDEGVKALMKAGRKLQGPIMRHTYPTLIGLLAVTGMRAGEAFALDHADLKEQEGFLLIRNAKFGKSRNVYLHPTTLEAMQDYARTRDRVFPCPRDSSYFVSTAGTRLLRQNVSIVFARLLKKAGLASEPGDRPRIHDFRHSFAVKTLIGWYRAGLDVETHLPLLSTYLGHVNPSSTYWYLTVAPELACLAAERLENHMGDLP